MLGGALRTLGLGPTPGGGGSPGGKTPGGPDGGLIILGGGTPIIFHTNIFISKICQITSRIKIYLEKRNYVIFVCTTMNNTTYYNHC